MEISLNNGERSLPLTDYVLRDLCERMIRQDLFVDVTHLIITHKHIYDLCQDLLTQAKQKRREQQAVNFIQTLHQEASFNQSTESTMLKCLETRGFLIPSERNEDDGDHFLQLLDKELGMNPDGRNKVQKCLNQSGLVSNPKIKSDKIKTAEFLRRLQSVLKPKLQLDPTLRLDVLECLRQSGFISSY